MFGRVSSEETPSVGGKMEVWRERCCSPPGVPIPEPSVQQVRLLLLVLFLSGPMPGPFPVRGNGGLVWIGQQGGLLAGLFCVLRKMKKREDATFSSRIAPYAQEKFLARKQLSNQAVSLGHGDKSACCFPWKKLLTILQGKNRKPFFAIEIDPGPSASVWIGRNGIRPPFSRGNKVNSTSISCSSIRAWCTTMGCASPRSCVGGRHRCKHSIYPDPSRLLCAPPSSSPHDQGKEEVGGRSTTEEQSDRTATRGCETPS